MMKKSILIFTLLILIISGCKTQKEPLSKEVTPIPLSQLEMRGGAAYTNCKKLCATGRDPLSAKVCFSFR